MGKKTIYLDNAATMPMLPEVIEAIKKSMGDYGNPSAAYSLGSSNADAIMDARGDIAELVGANPTEIYFTSGGTEADNWALISSYLAFRDKGNRIITSKIEHHAVLNTCKILEKYYGADIVYVDVDKNGVVDVRQLEEAINDKTILISIMAVNNEIGSIQPLKEIGAIAKKHNVLFHSDAVQAYGHIPLDVNAYNIDMLSVSAHKIGGPKGIGFLYIRQDVDIPPLINGGGQERGMRSGTENVQGIIGFGAAASVVWEHMWEWMWYVQDLKKYFAGAIMAEISDCVINGGCLDYTAPNNLSVTFKGIRAEQLLTMLDMHGICVSTGSACNSHSDESSSVLRAIGLSDDDANATVRFTLSHNNTQDELDTVIDALKLIIPILRRVYE